MVGILDPDIVVIVSSNARVLACVPGVNLDRVGEPAIGIAVPAVGVVTVEASLNLKAASLNGHCRRIIRAFYRLLCPLGLV